MEGMHARRCDRPLVMIQKDQFYGQEKSVSRLGSHLPA
jgi:hypothetical protein